MNFELTITDRVFEYSYRTRHIHRFNEFVENLRNIKSFEQITRFYNELTSMDHFHDTDPPRLRTIIFEGRIVMAYLVHFTVTEILCGVTLGSVDYSHDKHYHIFKFFYHVQNVLSSVGDGSFHFDPTRDLHNDDITRTYNKMLLTNEL